MIETVRKARIVATLGPASQDEATLERLLRAGVNVIRLNFSHGSHEQHAANIATIRSLAARLGLSVGILQDLQGPKTRVGKLDQASVRLEAGERVWLYAEGEAIPRGVKKAIPIDFVELFRTAQSGDRILLDDGHLVLKTVSVGERVLEAEVVTGGTLSSGKGVNLPGRQLEIPGFTEKDRDDLTFGLSQGVDAVAVSFVRSARDLEQVRAAIRAQLSADALPPLLIAKLERPEALENLEEILEASDGVM
ncbi:MAG: pyruvate kinase, partial [Anaerolineae bacterium]